jgi:hypothetical protein
MSELKVNKVTPRSGTTVTLGDSGDTITIPSGVTFSNSGTVTGITQGITEADQWRLTANITTNTNPITSNLERNDNVGFNYIGTGMTVASGTWTFPTTGIWLVRCISRVDAVANDNVLIDLNTTTNNSTYALAAESAVSGDGSGDGAATAVTETIFDVTNTSTHKVQFSVDSITAGSTISGNTAYNHTYFTFIRLGDT